LFYCLADERTGNWDHVGKVSAQRLKAVKAPTVD
jgi:hypothetical protein